MAETSAKEVNATHQDAIRRQTIRRELYDAEVWESHWGFLRHGANLDKINEKAWHTTGPANDFADAAAHIPVNPFKRPPKKANAHSLCVASKLGPGLKNGDAAHDETIDVFRFTYNVRRIRTLQAPGEKLSFPSTTSEQIGWHWNGPAGEKAAPGQGTFYTLEKFGRLG